MSMSVNTNTSLWTRVIEKYQRTGRLPSAVSCKPPTGKIGVYLIWGENQWDEYSSLCALNVNGEKEASSFERPTGFYLYPLDFTQRWTLVKVLGLFLHVLTHAVKLARVKIIFVFKLTCLREACVKSCSVFAQEILGPTPYLVLTLRNYKLQSS